MTAQMTLAGAARESVRDLPPGEKASTFAACGAFLDALSDEEDALLDRWMNVFTAEF